METPITRILLGTLVVAGLAGNGGAHASTFRMLHAFTGDRGDCFPEAGLVFDSARNLYGTTAGGVCNGEGSSGTIYTLALHRSEAVSFAFSGGSGGAEPLAPLTKNGNLWGTTIAGGIGGGVIFEFSTKGREKLIHTFEGSPDDGCDPEGAMVTDKSGNLYGQAFGCGKRDYGAVFELAASGSESLLYSFKGGRDGFFPSAGLIIDAHGNLFGTTDYGGIIGACTNLFGGCGTIFRLAPDGTKTQLYEFKGPPGDGLVPGKVIMDSSGNLYGTTMYGGRAGCDGDLGCGIVFKISPDGAEAVLHFFRGGKQDGANPAAGLVEDASGNLYGTTQYGGGRNNCGGVEGCGIVYEIAPDGTESILHSFGDGSKGANPVAGLLADGKGNYYGTASEGGAYGYGTVFEITP